MRGRTLILLILTAAISTLVWRTHAFHQRQREAREPFPRAWRDLGDVRADDTPLERVLADWSSRTGARLTANWTDLDRVGLSRQTPVRLRLSAVTVATAMDALTDTLAGPDRRLTWDWDDRGIATLTTEEAVATAPRVMVQMYRMPELPDFSANETPDVMLRLLEETVDPTRGATTAAPSGSAAGAWAACSSYKPAPTTFRQFSPRLGTLARPLTM